MRFSHYNMDDTANEAVKTDHSTTSNEAPQHTPNNQQLLKDYIAARSPEFRQLCSLRREGWENPAGDDFFNQQRQTADNPSHAMARNFYKMTIDIGRKLSNQTKAFDVLQASKEEPLALDMGMAPGGFSTAILECCPRANVTAITLPHRNGGHAVQFRHGNLKLELRDINTLAGDMGFNTIPETHHEVETLITQKLLGGQAYHLAICGGQITRNHQREEWRQHREGRRLQLAQLVIAMKHLQHNGTLIAVLHKPELLGTAEALQVFSGFSDIVLFKPYPAHAKRSSFYMVAKNVKSHSPAAIKAVEAWREEWRIATLGSDDDYKVLMRRTTEETQTMLEEYGEELVALGRPIWAIQARALAKAPFIKRK